MIEPVPLRSFHRDQMREERLEILRLLEAGGITADEAATLLDALDRAALPLGNSGPTPPLDALDLATPLSGNNGSTLPLGTLDRAAPLSGNNGSTPPRGAEECQVRIRVTDSTTGRAMVNLAFPLGLIKSGLDIAGMFVPEYLPKVEAIRESVTAGFRGSMVDVDDGSRRVEIIAE